MLGQRALYEDGWLACTLHPPLSSWGKFDQDVWELYHVEVDRSQSTNLADAEPERVQAMVARWFELAEEYNGLPARRPQRPGADARRASQRHPARDRYVYYPDCASVPEQSAVAFSGRSYTISAGVHVDSADAEGVIFAQGGVAGGHSLFVQDGRLHYVFNWVGTHLQTVTADRALEPGAHVITAEFVAAGPQRGPDDGRRPRPAHPLRRRRGGRQRRRSSPSRAPSAWSVTGCAWAATTPRPCRRPTPRRSRSPVAPSTRWSSTSPASATVDHEAEVRGWFILD